MMSELFEILTDNSLISAIIAAAIVGFFSWLISKVKDYLDIKVILKFLTESAAKGYTFRSTEAIASKTKLTEGRVEALCAKHPKIIRNSKEKQSWKLEP